MKKILCIAKCCCDLIFGNLPRIPVLGQEEYGDSFTIRPGGGANTPMNLGLLGADVTLLTGVGADDMGANILKSLESANVRVLGALQKPGTRTAVSAVLSTKEDRCFASYDGTGEEFFTPEQLEKAIRQADIVHTYLGYCVAYPIAQLCEKYGKELSLDTAWAEGSGEAEKQILRRCDWLKINQGEAARLTGEGDPTVALKKLAGLVRHGAVITLGERGSIGMTGREQSEGESHFQPAVSMGEFQDACGAGDAYAAGLLWGISQGESLEKSMQLGAITSGFCVTCLGGNSETLNCTIVRNRFCIN